MQSARVPQDHKRPGEDRLLTVEDVAEFLGVPVATLYAWRCRGLGPRGLKVGRHLRYRRAEVDRWLDQGAPAA